MAAPIVRAPITILRSIGGLTFDVTIEEKHSSHLEIETNPVETGVVITDHSFMEPLKLTVKVGVSNTPLHVRDDDNFASSSQTRIQAAFDLLRALQASGEPFDIQTGLNLYTNMLCSDVTVDQDASTANALVFDAQFQEVIFVTTQTVTFAARKVKHSKSKTKDGKKQPEEEKEPEKKGSLLSKMFEILSGKPDSKKTTDGIKSLVKGTEAEKYIP